MPGVPSGRGCDACRKQKKKCDLQKPRCMRCARLDIPCIGNGKKRFKFQVQVMGPGSPSGSGRLTASPDGSSSSSSDDDKQTARSRSSSCSRPRSRSPAKSKSPVQFLIQTPQSQTFVVASAFVSRLEIDDLKFDLDCYGPFMKQIPARLGTNSALDASADALVTTFSPVHGCNSVQALTKYIDALKALRVCLSDPSTARSAETICAVYLMMICQGWMGRQGDHRATHAEGLALLLESTADEVWFDTFAMELRVTMLIPVIVESVVNPRIKIGPWLYKILDGYRIPSPEEGRMGPVRDDPHRINTLKLRNLAQIPQYLHNPGLYRFDILAAYHELLGDVPKVQHLLAHIRDTVMPVPHATRLRLQRGYETVLGILSSIGLVFNYFLRAFDPLDPTLAREAASFSADIINLAEVARSYRPIGASWVPLCLVIAWASTQDADLQVRFEMLLLDYQQDYACTNYFQMAHDWRRRMEELCLRLGDENETDNLEDENIGINECCIL